MANHVSSKLDVEFNGMVIEELKNVDMDVVLTQAQQVKVEIPLMADNFKEKELRKPKIKQDWEKQEAIYNSMLEAIENINQQEVVARVQKQAQQRIATIVDEFGSSSGNPLEDDWVGFPEVDALESSNQRNVGQCTEGLHDVGQPNAGLHYTGQGNA